MSETLAPSQSVVNQRDPKGRKFMDIVGQQYDKAGLSDGPDGEAQRVNNTAGLADLIANFIAEARRTDKFKDEEKQSSYQYPKEYKGSRPINAQILMLATILDLDPASALEYAKQLPALDSFVPMDALPWTGWFAVPSVAALAKKHFPEVIDPAEQYCRAIQLIHEKLATARQFYNYRAGEITPSQLRMHLRMAEALARVAEMQNNGDILIVTAQLGLRHRGRSVRRAREVFIPNEYGHGSLTGGSILLTHPEREVRWEQLHMDLPGDEFAPSADGRFVRAPIFSFSDGKLKFGASGFDDARGSYGSASGFLPQ